MRDDRLSVEIRAARPHDHTVHIYRDEHALTNEVARFVTSGLELGESVVVAMTSEHRAAIAALLGRNPPAHAGETLVFLDADDALDQFMVEGTPDRGLLEAMIGPIFEAAARGGRPIRACGEMVALLWARGNVAGALALESLWNDLAAEQRFFLMCAYPTTCFDESTLRDVDAMRESHSQSWLLGLSTQHEHELVAAPADTSHILIPVPMPATVPVARQFAIDTLHDWKIPEFVEAAAAITSELAANAVLHARTAYRLTLSRSSTSLRIAVEDAVPCPLDIESEHTIGGTHHGLATVQARATRCGNSVAPEGKTVWAELQMPGLSD